MVKKFVLAVAVIALLSGCKSVIVRHDVPVHVVERHHVYQRPAAPVQQVIVQQHVHVEQTYTPPPAMPRPPIILRPILPPPHAGKPGAPDQPPPRAGRPVAPPPSAGRPDVPPPLTRPVLPPPHRLEAQPLPRETARAPALRAPWPGNPAR